MFRLIRTTLFVLGLTVLLAQCVGCAGASEGRVAMWIDVYDGEPTSHDAVLDDMATVRVVYMGERHGVPRHHDLQLRVVQDLAARDLPLVLGLEQMEACYQPILDAYNQGTLSFDELAKRTEWKKRWSNYEDYRPIIEAAHAAGAPVLALNAKKEIVRQVAMKGIDGLDAEARKGIPPDIQLDDPLYAAKLSRIMMVHAKVTEEFLHRMFQAQVARDETMSYHLCQFLQSEAGQGRLAVVLCGSGHVAHGLGIPTRVQRRIPGIKDRVVVMSASGDVELSPGMKAMMRDITITHEQIRDLKLPLADYLHIKTTAKASE